uniref:ribosomal protein L18 n=1 Tax=Pseudoerythrocladia kornmannii TaxID=753682 RepID=UPI001BEED9A1|nr:ribosomal protein L18 [Pseudoerythrocladia kornmannii]QUE28274.1 ribosomal protein L18 [Pseudoerythrocladia kornmannii]UNJ16779.1 ribosomal protein L18 [Pseudoerythrocladia kornmannii]
MKINRKHRTANKHKRIRTKIKGVPNRPRLTVFRSNEHIYAQVIDDVKQTTLAASSTKEATVKTAISTGKNCEAAKLVGETIADKILNLGIKNIVFDRGGKLYHGRVQVLAEAMRNKGLQF